MATNDLLTFPNFEIGLPASNRAAVSTISRLSCYSQMLAERKQVWTQDTEVPRHIVTSNPSELRNPPRNTDTTQSLTPRSLADIYSRHHVIKSTSALPSELRRFRREVQKTQQSHDLSLAFWRQFQRRGSPQNLQSSTVTTTTTRTEKAVHDGKKYELHLKLPTTVLINESIGLESCRAEERKMRRFLFNITHHMRTRERIGLREWEWAMGEPTTGEAETMEYRKACDPIFGKKRRRIVIGGTSSDQENESDSTSDEEEAFDTDKKRKAGDSSNSSSKSRLVSLVQQQKRFKTDWETHKGEDRQGEQKAQKFKTNWNEDLGGEQISKIDLEKAAAVRVTVSEWLFAK